MLFAFFRHWRIYYIFFFARAATSSSNWQNAAVRYNYISFFLYSHQYTTSHTEYAEQTLRWNTETQRNISYINWREIRWSREWMNLNNGRKVIQLWRWRKKKLKLKTTQNFVEQHRQRHGSSSFGCNRKSLFSTNIFLLWIFFLPSFFLSSGEYVSSLYASV